MALIDIAKKSRNILRPYGHTEVLLYYGIVAKKLKKYLKGKEIATKIWLPKSPRMPYFLRRGSKETPLYIEEFCKETNEKLLKTRKDIEKLKNALPKITKIQAKIWNYFVPRKLVDFFYATNGEGKNKSIERIFFDIDRRGVSPEKARKTTKKLVELILKDRGLKKIISFRIFVMWTGASFHVYLMLKKPATHKIYDKYFAYRKDFPLESFTGKWAKAIKDGLKINVIGGHEKKPNTVNIDPSQTPSGKLCRAPFSLHMKDARTVDGVALPVSIKDLADKNLIKRLKSYTPEKVIKDLNKLSKLLL